MRRTVNFYDNTTVIPLAFAVAIVVFHMQGVFSVLGVPTLIPRAIGESLIIGVCVYAIKVAGLKALVSDRPLAVATTLFVTLTLVSLAVSEDSLFGFVLFMRLMAISFLVFLALPHAKLTNPTSWSPAAVVEIMFAVQIIATIIKLLVRGRDEGVIGTISLQAGELAVTYPAIILAFTFPILSRKLSSTAMMTLVAIVIGTFAMAILSIKRAYIFFFVIVILSYLVTDFDIKRRLSSPRVLLPVILLMVVGVSISFLVIKITPSLNPEKSDWGTVSPAHVRDYTLGYMFRESTDLRWTETVVDLNKGEIPPESVTLGRQATMNFHLRQMADNGKIFFGYGPGSALISSLHHTIQDVRHRFDFAWSLTGFNWLFLQVGLAGAIAFMSLFAIICWRGFRLAKSGSTETKVVGVSVVLMMVVVFIDLLLYGFTTVGSGVIFPVFAYFVVSALQGRTGDVPFIRWLNMPGENIRQKITAGYISPFVPK